MDLVMKGVKKAIKKFYGDLRVIQHKNFRENTKSQYTQPQLHDVANAPCFALDLVGNVSPMIIQIPGAQVLAYPRMKRHVEMIITIHTSVRFQ